LTDLPRYQTILLATDGSESADLAVRHAVALAKHTGAALWAAYVVDTHQAFRVGIYEREALRELRRDGEQALKRVSELGREAGVPVETHLCEGRPGQVLVDEAEQANAELIVIGSHGQGAISDILLGSVSQYVVHHAAAPVLIVRPPKRR
jgi:nucleotide-binding universal stress UspA family protein